MSPVSVVVATRNRVAELMRTLERLTALPEAPEVVVVDNASGDGTPAAVRARFPGVRVLALPSNAGAAARNAGARHATHEVIAFCDDDSWWEPGALDAAGRLFGSSPRLGVVAGQVVVEPDGETDPTCERMARSPIWSPLEGPNGQYREVLGFLACGAVVSKAAFLEVGGFRRELMIGGEEALVAIDLAVAGWNRIYAPHVVAHHHPSGARDPARRQRLETRNALWVDWARRPTVTSLRRSLSHLAGAASRPAALLGVYDAAVAVRWAVEHRAVVPAGVEKKLRAVERAG